MSKRIKIDSKEVDGERYIRDEKLFFSEEKRGDVWK